MTRKIIKLESQEDLALAAELGAVAENFQKAAAELQKRHEAERNVLGQSAQAEHAKVKTQIVERFGLGTSDEVEVDLTYLASHNLAFIHAPSDDS